MNEYDARMRESALRLGWTEELVPPKPSQEEEQIRQRVQDAMAHSMAGFDFETIIEHAELSSKDEAWAKKHLDWQIVVLPE